MKLELAILAGAVLIAASILFVGRYEIAGTGGEGATLYRLDRWTGTLEGCGFGGADLQAFTDRWQRTGHATFECGIPVVRK